MLYSSKKKFFDGFSFEICENVYDPAEDSFFFAENLDVKEGTYILDMGTGSGILGIVAADKASEVLAVDINPYSIVCAKHNALLNKVYNKMSFLRADLFSSFVEEIKFDLILFNAPYLPSEVGETDFWLGRSWSGGANGREVIDPFIFQAPHHLKRSGQIFLLQSNLTNVDQTILGFTKNSLRSRVVATLSLPFFEELVLINAGY
jgi:release factor glutamine methyltransferase